MGPKRRAALQHRLVPAPAAGKKRRSTRGSSTISTSSPPVDIQGTTLGTTFDPPRNAPMQGRFSLASELHQGMNNPIQIDPNLLLATPSLTPAPVTQSTAAQPAADAHPSSQQAVDARTGFNPDLDACTVPSASSIQATIQWLSNLASGGGSSQLSLPTYRQVPDATAVNAGLPQLSYKTDHIGAHVKDSVRQKIWNGEFVDFQTLLPSQNVAQDGDVPLQMVFNQAGQVMFKPASKQSSKPLSIASWTTAFHIFMSIYLQKHPGAVQELLGYVDAVRGAAHKYGNDSWYTYDYYFRHKMARDPTRSWGAIDGDLWLRYMVHGRQSYNLTDTKSSTAGSVTAVTDKQVCWDFNFSQCSRLSCKYPHKCSKCKSSNHSARQCNSFRSKPTNNAQVQLRNRASLPPSPDVVSSGTHKI
ncbi:uncharacterized protein [Haliotis asinina]|uniref:uncharacterized protein n=1 Tax=Haliotis asinina TaxID=109174 RepID=UPI0035324A40